MKTQEYIEQEVRELEELKIRFNEIKTRWIRFGLKKEQEFLERYIKLKQDMIAKLGVEYIEG